MNRFSQFLLTLTLLLATHPASADVSVSEKSLQAGIFSPPGCNNASECLCEANISYPVISGMKDGKQQTVLNETILKSAEQLGCQGSPAKSASKGDNFSVKHSYEITLQTPNVLGFKFTDWAYEGGAHGNSLVEGMIIDLTSGKILEAEDLFGKKNIARVNQVIYDTLLPKSDGIFHDEIERRKGTFIQDGKCIGCTIVASKEGIQIVFQTYEVAPFADGNPVVPVPRNYLVHPALTKILAEKK